MATEAPHGIEILEWSLVEDAKLYEICHEENLSGEYKEALRSFFEGTTSIEALVGFRGSSVGYYPEISHSRLAEIIPEGSCCGYVRIKCCDKEWRDIHVCVPEANKKYKLRLRCRVGSEICYEVVEFICYE